MKDSYDSIDDFIADLMPIEFRKILRRRLKPEKRGSDSVAYKFEEKLIEIMSDSKNPEPKDEPNKPNQK